MGGRAMEENRSSAKGSPDSWCGGGGGRGKHVVVVMDALKQFSSKPLEWALEHVVEPGYMLTLLGVMPWLSLPLSCKIWLDIWTLDLGDLSILKDHRAEWKNDPKHLRLLNIVELCEARGVVPLIKVVMGHPVRLVVLEQTTNLHATWIVFDRYHRKRRAFYKKRIPCNMVMMNADGQVDILRDKSLLDSRESLILGTPLALAPPVPELITSKERMEIIKEESDEAGGSSHSPS